MSINGIGRILWPVLERMESDQAQALIHRIWRMVGGKGQAPRPDALHEATRKLERQTRATGE